jgi:hypothetical protein
MVETGGDHLSDRLRLRLPLPSPIHSFSALESNTSEHWPESTRTLDTNRVRSRSSGAEATHAARRRGLSCSQSQRATCSGTRTRTTRRLARGEGRVGTLCVKQSNTPAIRLAMACLAACLLLLRCTRPAMLLPCVALPLRCPDASPLLHRDARCGRVPRHLWPVSWPPRLYIWPLTCPVRLSVFAIDQSNHHRLVPMLNC